MRIDVYHHFEFETADEIRGALGRIERILRNQMATQAEIIALLNDAKTETDNIAADIERLLERPDVPDDVADALREHVATLQGVAAVVPEPEPEPTP